MAVEREDDQRSHDESCDLPNGVDDETHNTDENSHDESCDVRAKSPDRGGATPSNQQPHNDTDSAGEGHMMCNLLVYWSDSISPIAYDQGTVYQVVMLALCYIYMYTV